MRRGFLVRALSGIEIIRDAGIIAIIGQQIIDALHPIAIF